jgi:hypothetical protein
LKAAIKKPHDLSRHLSGGDGNKKCGAHTGRRARARPRERNENACYKKNQQSTGKSEGSEDEKESARRSHPQNRFGEQNSPIPEQDLD